MNTDLPVTTDLFDLTADPTQPVDRMAFAPDAPATVISRWYAEAPAGQYLRELVKNGVEADATRIELGPDLLGIDPHAPVWRLKYADDGCGMSADELADLLNQLSRSGKRLGAGRNHGIGARITTLPWNKHGVVVMSWKEGRGNMIRIRWQPDPDSQSGGTYGLHKFPVTYDDATEGFEEVIEAPDAYKPAWLEQHGTVIVLLGDTGREHTYFGPGGQPGADPRIVAWLNRRFAALPPGLEISVTRFESAETDRWPRNPQEAVYGGNHANVRRNTVTGALATFHRYTDETTRGVRTLADGTRVHWWLLADVGGNGSRRADQSRSVRTGCVAALHDGELYELVSATDPRARGRYGEFGIIYNEVLRRVVLVAEPPALDPDHPHAGGAQPDSARARLLVLDGEQSGEPLPWELWGREFCESLPTPIQAAIESAASEQDAPDDRARDRLKPYLKRLVSPRWRRDETGDEQATELTAATAEPGDTPAVTAPGGGQASDAAQAGASRPAAREATDTGQRVRRIRPRDPAPSPRWVAADELAPGRAASYVASRNEVLINRDHPVFAEITTQLASRFVGSTGVSGRVRRAVEAYFETDLCAKVFHVTQLRGHRSYSRSDIERMLSDEALTTAVLGLWAAEEHLRGTIGRSLPGLARRSA